MIGAVIGFVVSNVLSAVAGGIATYFFLRNNKSKAAAINSAVSTVGSAASAVGSAISGASKPSTPSTTK